MEPGSTLNKSVKGPLVWLDNGSKTARDAYDQSVYAPNQPLMPHRRKDGE